MRQTLGAQITIRLEPELAAGLREIAQGRRVGYTTLVREWVEERLALEMSQPSFQVAVAGYAGMEPVTASSKGRVRLEPGEQAS